MISALYIAALIINFGLRLKEEPTKLAVLWRTNLLHETVLYVTFYIIVPAICIEEINFIYYSYIVTFSCAVTKAYEVMENCMSYIHAIYVVCTIDDI